MPSHLISGFTDELVKLALKKIKSNDPMPVSSKANVNAFMENIHEWDSPHRDKALKMAEELSDKEFFKLMHSMRRWYTGQTMASKLIKHNKLLGSVMRLKPEDVVGIYRGFKVPNSSPLAKLAPGDKLILPVTRNRGVSSWSTSEEATNRFSGGGKGKTGLIVKLVDSKNINPILAPPSHTDEWFNEFYAHSIGKSFRPKEGEYLIEAPEVHVEVVRVKR